MSPTSPVFPLSLSRDSKIPNGVRHGSAIGVYRRGLHGPHAPRLWLRPVLLYPPTKPAPGDQTGRHPFRSGEVSTVTPEGAYNISGRGERKMNCCGRTFNLLQQWRLPSTAPSRGRAPPQFSKSEARIVRHFFLMMNLLGIRSIGRTIGGRIKQIFTTVERRICLAVCVSQEVQGARNEAVDKRLPSTSLDEREHGIQEKSSRMLKAVGAFQKLPMVMPSIDILSSAKRKARRVGPTKGIANIAKREKNKGAKQLDALMKELTVPLRGYLENFPKRYVLHPYERSLVQLTLGEGNYEEVLGRVDSLRKKILSLGKQEASLCAQSSSKREAEERLNEGVKKLEEVFQLERHAIEDLLNIAKTLRAMPVVDPETPTLCLVGAPNVGKSSLVRILSTGKPEVCNYPFTTRGILMGHISLNYERFQVTDTPGLLKRHDGRLFVFDTDERNNLEMLTLAVLSHLPTAVLYVHDLSGECGTSASDQFVIYKEIKERFKDHLWLDVVSKCDLLQEPQIIIQQENEVERYKKFGPDGAICVSVTYKIGVDELQSRVHDLLISQMSRGFAALSIDAILETQSNGE
ncbi:hypothetical protein Taro_006577, partial [Colocasia esculenta]|nr:hypothetical protein [Colocasia esculenta]